MIIYEAPSAYEAFTHLYDADISLSEPDLRKFGHSTDRDQIVFMCALAKVSTGPIIEFGTFTGKMALNMSLNTKHSIYTIDIGAYVTGEGYNDYIPGCEFMDRVDLYNSPKLIIGDSKTVDVPVARGEAGLVYIDGGHDYETVVSDSARAMQFISDLGIIVWDDYNPAWPGVVKCVNELPIDCILLRKECMIVGPLPPTALAMVSKGSWP